MMSLLTLHTMAAARGDGLRPELLAAIAQESLMSAPGTDGSSLHASMERPDGRIGSPGNDPGTCCAGRLNRSLSAWR